MSRLACGRRRMLAAGAAGAAAVARRALRPAAAAVPRSVLVAGAAGGPLDHVALALVASLRRGWPDDGSVEAWPVGGEDGVTGANQFETRDPVAATALLLPGEAAASWLAGDPRVHFDAARWVPVTCAVSGGVLAGRRHLSAASRAAPLRLALTDRLGPAAACLLGLDLLGANVLPVGVADGGAALRAGRVDAAFLRAAALPLGTRALLTLGAPERPAADARDPGLADVPALSELLARVALPDAPLLAAWYAVSAAAQLAYALVLPPLTAAAEIARWREAALRALADPSVRAAAPPASRALAPLASVAVMGAIATSSAALLAYRRWLAIRLAYQPG